MTKISGPTATPPSATGDAGGHFEARVAAYYMLCMLSRGQPRGLPGAEIDRVALQQRLSGHPLDDIIVHAREADGSPATLEIQVKRSMAFTASDREFVDVSVQLLQASRKPEFQSQRYELGIAIAKTTTRVEKHVQEALRWARVYPDCVSFFKSLNSKGFATDDMRSFVLVLRKNLQDAGGTADDPEVWSVLRRLQVMSFDFENPGSDYEHRALERAATVLASASRHRAADLWRALIMDVEAVMSAGGARERLALLEHLAVEGPFQFDVAPNLRPFFANLADQARLAVQDMEDTVAGARLSRSSLVDAALERIETHKVVNITGAGGVGKSAVLRHVIDAYRAEGCPIILSNTRIVAGGWNIMAHVLGASVPSDVLFGEIAATGGAVVFIDNLDQIEAPAARATVLDLLRAVDLYPGWRVVVTTNASNVDWRTLLPETMAASLASIDVAEIDDTEAKELRSQSPRLAAILAPDHPAQRMARNLFFLRRLDALGGGAVDRVSTEMDLAKLWWGYGGGRGQDAGRLARLRTLRAMAMAIWQRPAQTSLRSDDLDSDIVTELLRLDTLREVIAGADVSFAHDVQRDWSVGFLIRERPDLFRDADKREPLPAVLARALEVTARLAIADDPGGAKWLELVRLVDGADTHGSWRRPIVLAAARSENVGDDLNGLWGSLTAENAKLLRELLRHLLVVDTIPAGEWFGRFRPDVSLPKVASNLAFPAGRNWFSIIAWLVTNAGRLPRGAIPEAASVFFSWLLAMNQFPVPTNAEILAILFDWLALIDEDPRPAWFSRREDVPPPLEIPNLKETGDQIRTTAFTFALLNPPAAQRYLSGVNAREVRYPEFQEFIKARGNLARAAPSEFADLMLKELQPDPDEEDRRRYGPFMVHEAMFMPASPAQGPFLEIISADKASGLRLIRGVVAIAADWMIGPKNADRPSIGVPFPGGGQSFVGGGRTYAIARSTAPSSLVASALMALEAWAHGQIEAGRPAGEVLEDIIGPDGTSAAFLSVAVDVVISHWSATRDIAWPYFGSPRLLKLDTDRAVQDVAGVHKHARFQAEPNGPVKLADLDARPSRGVSLMNLIVYYAFAAESSMRASLSAALDAGLAEIELDPPEADDPLHGLLATGRRARRMLDPANWRDVEVAYDDGTVASRKQFVPEEEEQELFETSHLDATVRAQRSEMIAWIHLALRDSALVTPERLREAVIWAKSEGEADPAEDDTEREMAARAVVTVAALVARDCGNADRGGFLIWARPILDGNANQLLKDVFENEQVDFNSAAIATLGLVALAGPDVPIDQRARTLLPLATHAGPAVANALGRAFRDWPDEDPLTRSVLRVLMVRSTYPWVQFGDGNKQSLIADHTRWVERHARAEAEWLAATASEPPWPELPPWLNRPRKKRRITRNGLEKVITKERQEPDRLVNGPRMVTLLNHVFPLMIGRVPAWIVPMTEHFMTWTVAANTGEEDDSPEGRPYELNAAVYQNVGFLCAALPQDAAVAQFINPILTLGDDAFHEAAAGILRGFDIAVLSTDALKPADVLTLRAAIAGRIRSSWNYARIGSEKGLNSERNAGDALTALFFSQPAYMPFRAVNLPKDWAGIDTVLPLLADVVAGAPLSGYLATLFLDLLDAAPRTALIPWAIAASVAWADAYGPDVRFWVHHEVGPRFCAWMAARLGEASAVELSAADTEKLLKVVDIMMKAGVTTARRIEEVLLERSGADRG